MVGSIVRHGCLETQTRVSVRVIVTTASRHFTADRHREAMGKSRKITKLYGGLIRMLQTKKIGNDLCAVAFNPTEIMVRKSGKQYFGKEKTLVKLDNEGLVIDEDIACEFGIKIFWAMPKRS